MSFATTMTALKDKVDGLIANRVAKFAYTQQAYNSDNVNGVTTYDFNNEQNIPTSSASVLKVNETVLTKGWRTQASAITRMLMNHFLGRTSYNLNKTVDFLKAFMLAIENNMGVAEGFATLDENTQLPLAQLTPAVVVDCGEWDADTNTPELEIGEGRKGDTYRVSVAGTQDLGEGSVIYHVGDTIMYNGSIWVKTASGTVTSVNTVAPDNTGNVTVTGDDISSSWYDKTNLTNKMSFIAKLSFTYLLGRHWRKTSSIDKTSNAPFNEKALVLYENGYYYRCVTGTTGGILKSSDGVTWENTGVNYSTIGEGVVAIKFVKIDNRVVSALAITTTHILYSTDYFETFTTAFTASGVGAFQTGYFSDNYGGVLCIMSNRGILRTTDNGASWEVVGSVFSQSRSNITLNKAGRIMMAGGYLRSLDLGITWNTSLPSEWEDKKCPVYFALSNVYLCWGGTGMYYSTDDLSNFHSCVNGTASVSSMTITDVAYGNAFVATTSSNGIIFSTDGITWNKSNITSGNYTKVVNANGIFVAQLYGASKLKYSLDGVTWTDCTMTSSTYRGLTCCNGVFIVHDKTNGYLLYSNDGISWHISYYLVDTTIGDAIFIQYTHGIIFRRYTNDNYTEYLYVSSVDDLIERGWVNID